ncbi:MAG TPA: PA14 domain-containing protein, partial [Bacteroidales bacterium]|nr:PA14 domain-containing protein [Bacteroidales bacterium]
MRNIQMAQHYNGITCRTIAVLLMLSVWNVVFASVSVKVFSLEEAISEGNISKPRIYIKNTGTETIENFTYRYFFTTENGQAPMVEPYYLTDKEQVMLVPYGDGYYVQYTINNASLTPGGLMPHSLGNCIGLHYNSWSTWDKSNDFSNNLNSSFAENQNISVYVAGTRIFGNEPGGSGGVESGYAWREIWTNISGTSTDNIPVSMTPNLSGPLSSLDEPKQYGDNFGSRIRGYITAPLSGSYTFWIASDDGSRFYLSTDEDPANKGTSPIAWITDGYTSSYSYEWNKYSTQKSIEKILTAGSKYYFEILHKDATQDDNCSVGWLKPGQSGSFPSEIVPSSVLSPYFAPEAPVSPINLTATAVSSSRIDLSWTDASNNECSFSIQMKYDSGEFTDLAIVSANQTSYQATGLTTEKNYTFRVRACNTYGNSDYGNTAQATTFAIVLGGATRELWIGCAGITVADIPVNTTPTDIKQIDSLESTQQSADYFGRRIRGYIIPPASGTYTFWIASDDYSQLWLSTNDQASSKVLIASVSGCASYREWNKYPSQKSNVQILNAGVRYYFEILHKEGNQNDNLSVGWIKPGQSGSVPSQIVPKSALSPFVIPSIPAAPGGLVAKAISSTQIDLTWTDNSNNESGFFIERAAAAGTFIQISSAAANSGIFHDAGLTANTQYQYRIRSFNDLGSSGYSNTASAITSEPEEKSPSTVNLSSFAIYSTEKTKIGSRCHFFGNGGAVGSNKEVEILPDDTVHGNVVSGGTISILDRDLIEGDIIAAGAITINPTATVRGEIQPNATVAMLTIPTLTSIPTSNDSVLVGDRQTRLLLPGCYDRITVLNSATLTLSPGIYTCKKLFIGPDAHIILDVTSADIVDVQVTGDVEFSDRCNVSFKEDGKGYVPFIRFYTNSSNIVRIGCQVLLNGMLIAPNGHICMNSRTRCNGALYGKYITIEPDAGFLSDDITSQCEDSDGDHVANILEVLMGTDQNDANDFFPIAVPSTACIDNSQEVTITYDYSIFYPEFDGAKNVIVTFPPHSLSRENVPLIIQVKNIPTNGQIFEDSVTYAQVGRYFEFTKHNSIVDGKSAIIGFPLVEGAVYPSTKIMQNMGLGFFGPVTTTYNDGNTVYASISSNEPKIIVQKAEGKQTFYFDDGTIYSNHTNSVLNYDFDISIEGASGTESATATINYT